MKRLIRARIDSAALRANLKFIRSRAPTSRVMAVVKANAYGHGLVPTARALAEADAFAVARLEEGIALREAGLQHRIVLLEGVFDTAQLAEAAHHRFDLVVHERLQLELLEKFRGSQPWSLWLKIDTGMNRLGFRPEQFADAYSRLRALPVPPGELCVMTHLSSADDTDQAITDGQLARFRPLVRDLNLELSIANSAATLMRPDTHGAWVRPGLAIYGISPFASQTGPELGLRPAMTLESTVIALRDVPTGESVGYGATWRASRASRIAIVAAGYGDGLPRSLASGAPVQVGSGRGELVGRVSMDMIAVDITGLPPVAVGDRVELWGNNVPVEQLALAAGTIPYELICAISQRVPIELI